MWRSLGDLQKKMLILSLGLSFIFIFAFSFSVGVDMSAHLGGFICGMVMGLGYFSKLWAEDNWWHQHGKVIAFGMVAATIIIPAIYFWHNEELGYGNSDF
jgi:membrane associated rhomboid family serine protease